MYRRARRGYRRRTHRRRRHVFGKKATRAIKAISQRPVETKWYIWNSDVLTDIPPVTWPNTPGNDFAIFRNIFQVLPRTNNASSESRSEVIGQKFSARGVSIRGFIAWSGPTSLSTGTMRVRISVVRTPQYFDQGVFGILSGASYFYEDDDTLPFTLKKYNMDRVHVVKSKVVTLGPPVSQSPRVFKMWVPIKRMLTCTDDEGTSVVVNQLVGRLKEWNYYCIMEFFAADSFSITAGSDFIRASTQVYFKDP